MIFTMNKIKIQRGDDINFFLILLEENGQPFQTSGASLITLQAKTTSNTVLEKAAAGGFGVGIGETTVLYSFTLTAAETTSLNAGMDQDVCIKVNFGSSVKHLVLKKAFDVGDLHF